MARQPDRRSPPRGASQGGTRLGHRFKGYLRHHRETFKASFRRLCATPVQTLMTVLVIAIALALPAGLYTGVENLRQLGGEVQASARMTLFLARDASDEAVDGLLDRVSAMDEVGELTFISRDEALAEFKASSGFGDLLDTLEQNPLPPVILVQPVSGLEAEPEAVSALASRLGEEAVVADVALDMSWLQRLQALVEAGRMLALALGALLGLGVLLVMGNTIRLAIENRRDEIVVVKLIGGTNGYVRRPFLYTGLWYGAAGGLLAWLLVWGGVYWLGGVSGRLAALYESGFSLSGPGLEGLLALLGGGALLGLAGAWLAVARHVRQIEPE